LPIPASNIKLAVLIPCMLFSASSWATDIQCESTRQPAQRIICDHAILNHEYDDVYEQQQRLLQEGKLTPSDVAAWKQKRDACTDVHCIDGVFAEASNTVDKSPANIVAAPVMTASEALGPASAALPASQVASAVSQQASSVPVSRQGSAYGVALPQSVPAAASAPAAVSAASANIGTASGTSSSPFFIVLGLLFVIVVLGVGAMVMYRRKRER
jgi:LPXTG-motif cell wall-anchored protein